MSEPRQVFDGHTAVFGMDGDTDATMLAPSVVSRSVNRTFRGGKNNTRPRFQEISLIFGNEEDENVFRNGNVQGMSTYLRKTPGRFNSLIVSIAGVIFAVSLVNENGYVSRIADGNNAEAMHAFFVQAEEWLYVQDGYNLPIFWNGIEAFSRSAGAEEKEMPVGTIMAYSHGRVFVSNDLNEIRASDVMFGSGFTNTRNVQKFTETEYWQEGGSFIIPSRLGKITGLATLPAISANLRGQGELVVFSEEGAMTLDVSLPRLSWKDAQIQKTALVGRGNIAPYSVVVINGDAWYKASDGWATYSNSRLDFTQRPSFRKFSRQVNNWLTGETQELRRYASHIYFDNRVLGTVQPEISLTRELDEMGTHRYFRGIVSLDLDPASGTTGGDVINFDGLWTGIRPTAMVTLKERAFAMSFDSDGINRLYEIKKLPGLDNGNKPIRSHYLTRRMSCSPSESSEFQIKKLQGAEIWVSGISNRASISIDFTPDHCGGLFSLLENRAVENEDPISQPIFRHIRTTAPDIDQCQPGSDDLISTGGEFQFLIRAIGSVRINRFRLYAHELQPQSMVGDTCVELETVPANAEKFLDDFEYLIVE